MMVYGDMSVSDKPVSLTALKKMRVNDEPIACLTAYDASFARRVDAAGADLVLVGDSLGMVVQGHDSTVPVAMDDMVYHTKLVARGLRRAYLVADLPFLSYSNPKTALKNAGRLLQEGGARMVKLEGTGAQASVVEALSDNGIPVCAHLGLRPQAAGKIGGFRVQGRGEEHAEEMLHDAEKLESSGADLLLLECVPQALAARICNAVSIPVIGIGAGRHVDGQILVVYDILDITMGRKPRFVQNFMLNQPDIESALAAYVSAVKDKSYPRDEHSFD